MAMRYLAGLHHHLSRLFSSQSKVIKKLQNGKKVSLEKILDKKPALIEGINPAHCKFTWN